KIAVQYLHNLIIICSDCSELAKKSGQFFVIIYCIHINFYGLYRLLKDASRNKMCLYTYPRLVKEGKELGVSLCIQVDGIPMYRRINLWFPSCFPNLFSVFLFHNNPF